MVTDLFLTALVSGWFIHAVWSRIEVRDRLFSYDFQTCIIQGLEKEPVQRSKCFECLGGALTLVVSVALLILFSTEVSCVTFEDL